MLVLIGRQAIVVSHRNKHNAHSPHAAGHLNALGPSWFDHGNRGNIQAHCLDLSLSNTLNVYELNEASYEWRTPILRKHPPFKVESPRALTVRMMVVPLPSNIMLHHASNAFAYACSYWRRDNYSKPPGLLGSS